MVDVLSILGSVKGKVLDAAHYDLLEHAYKLQQENITQLKENNAAIRESADLMRAELGRVKAQAAALERENEQLRARTPAPAAATSLSACALGLLQWLVEQDETRFSEAHVSTAGLGSKVETEAALDELEDAKLIDVSGYGVEGARYYLTDGGKRFLLALRKS